jgi:hypothetical protein
VLPAVIEVLRHRRKARRISDAEAKAIAERIHEASEDL